MPKTGLNGLAKRMETVIGPDPTVQPILVAEAELVAVWKSSREIREASARDLCKTALVVYFSSDPSA